MRLASFSVNNYRAFADPTRLELRPLTLLFGYNSAGKSALLRWLPIVAASTEADATSALALDADAARGATFDEILSRYASSGAKLSLGLEWSSVDTSEAIDLELRLLWESRKKQQIVEHLRVEGGAEPHGLDASWTLDVDAPVEQRRYAVRIDDGPVHERAISFEGLVPDPGAFEGSAAEDLMAKLAACMRRMRSDTHWLTALRAVPDRSTVLGAPPRRMGSNGARAGEFLAHDRRDDGSLLARVSQWYEKATGHRLDVRIDSVASEDRFSLVLVSEGSAEPIHVPLLDTGEGMAQVLPVLVLGALAGLGRLGDTPVLLLEHPELHLHPGLHPALAEFFCELAAQLPGSTTIIETHSENLLLRVQLAIARGELSADRVIVHWVRSLSEGPAVVDSVTFDELARPQGDWPPGVFSADIRLARELLELRRKRGAP